MQPGRRAHQVVGPVRRISGLVLLQQTGGSDGSHRTLDELRFRTSSRRRGGLDLPVTCPNPSSNVCGGLGWRQPGCSQCWVYNKSNARVAPGRSPRFGGSQQMGGFCPPGAISSRHRCFGAPGPPRSACYRGGLLAPGGPLAISACEHRKRLHTRMRAPASMPMPGHTRAHLGQQGAVGALKVDVRARLCKVGAGDGRQQQQSASGHCLQLSVDVLGAHKGGGGEAGEIDVRRSSVTVHVAQRPAAAADPGASRATEKAPQMHFGW